jgi:hypothetical protein
MKFTLVFSSHESIDLSVGGLFIPCFGWQIKGRNHFPHPDYPHYRTDDFQFLINLLRKNETDLELPKKLVLVIHPIGHGTAADIECLKADVQSSGYEIREVSF